MKYYTNVRIPIKRNGESIGIFSGTVFWEKDMNFISNVIGSTIFYNSNDMPLTSTWKVDETGSSKIHCLFVD